MGSTFIFAFNAIMPIILLVILGYLLKRIKFIDQYFVNILNKYVFRVGLPILLFYNVYSIENLNNIDWTVVLFSIVAILCVFFVGLLFVTIAIKDPQQKGVILQGIYRSNFALIGVPLAQALGGAHGLAVVSIIAAFTIPLLNVLSVISLSLFQKSEHGERISISKLVKIILTNPLIIGVFLGLMTLVVRLMIPVENGELVFSLKDDLTFSYTFIKMISQTASPMALIALGGQFEFAVIKTLAKQIIIGVTWRILVVPAAVLSIAYAISSKIPGINDSYPALIALFATPIAVSSSIMVNEMGGDKELAGQLVVWSTICSILTIFVTIVVMRSIGAI
ncbi:MAG: AEC family transporter [Firmicutes bacterium]|nr:AEC family transporter [Bacillota bacterium]